MKILLVGATGLVGQSLLKMLVTNSRIHNITIWVRKLSNPADSKITEKVIDFEKIQELDLSSFDAVFCTLGTTIKKAGSKVAFEKVDYEYPFQLAKKCKKDGVQTFGMVTAMGADIKSSIYYNRIKGQVEKAIIDLNFKRAGIFRPSMLLGDRFEFRLGEYIGKIVMQGLDILIPSRYKAIKAETVASAMVDFLFDDKKQGLTIYENQDMLSMINPT